MNIAILNDSNGHFEMFGYLMFLFNKKHTITVFYNNDRYNYIKFFETQFGNVKKEKLETFNNCFNKFNKVFVITMNNYLMKSFNEIKDITYGIIHAHHRKSSFIDNYITLYPKQMKEFKKISNDPNKKFYCTIPFYNISINNIPFEKKIYILYIGNLWDDDDDLKLFEKNIKYEIIYFTKRKNKGISRDMFTLNKYLQNSIFILGRKTWHYPYAYTGSLGLSFSFNVPIILPEFKQKEYKLPCITFKENYCELIDYINTINIDDYNKLLKNMDNIKDQEIEKNKKLFEL
jgi:hypothetical protein